MSKSEELEACRLKIVSQKKQIKDLERSLRDRKADAVRRLESHINGLNEDLAAAIAAQAKSDKEADKAHQWCHRMVSRIKKCHQMLSEEMVLDADSLESACEQAVVILNEQSDRIFQLQDEVKRLQNQLEDVQRMSGWGRA